MDELEQSRSWPAKAEVFVVPSRASLGAADF
jgi:hypothetical protein